MKIAPNVDKDVEKLNHLYTTVWNIKLKINLLYDPFIVLLGIYPIELKTYSYTAIYIEVFIVTIC